MSSAPRLSSDIEMIRRALHLLIQPGAVCELRVPHTQRGTVSGYFNDLDRLAEVAAKMSGKATGVYFTLNPVRPDLLARAENRIIPFAKHSTSDRDILRRIWLLVDFDPLRPAGISSSETEHAAALDRAIQCRDWLRGQGWPEPILCDSGNGGHLLYRVDLPNDEPDSALMKRCLEALAFNFSDSIVEVDQTTSNAARICKLYGTLAAKGDSLPERPYRLACLVEVPPTQEPVPNELLESLANSVPGAGRSKKGHNRDIYDGVDMGQWILEHNLEVDGPFIWKYGLKWIFKVCPWNPEHRNRSAYIVQFRSGAIAAGCLHKSCAGKGWSDLRGTVEPGWKERQHDKAPCEVIEEVIPPPEDQVAAFPVDALPERIARYVREASESLGCPLDLVGVPALSALGGAIGTSRVLEIKRDWRERPVLYSAVVSDPGTLKSPALDKALKPTYDIQHNLRGEFEEAKTKCRQDLADYQTKLAVWQARVKKSASTRLPERTADPGDGTEPERSTNPLESPPEKPQEPMMAQVFTTDSTLEALAELIQQNPRGLLFVRDELTGWARAMNQYRNGKGADRQGWLSFWNGAPVLVNRKGREPILLRDPFVCVTGCLPPDVLDELSDERGREDGFVHRILFAFPDRVDSAWSDTSISTEAVDGYTIVFERLRELASDDETEGEQPEPRVVPMTDQGKAAFVEWVKEHYAEMADKALPEHLRGPWAKMPGYCARLVLIVHECRFVSNEAKREAPDEDSVLRAIVLINYFKSHARRVYARLCFTPEDKRVTDAVTWIRRQGGSTTLRNLVTYRVAGCTNRREGEALLNELEERGYGKIVRSTPQSGGRQTIHFHLRDDSRSPQL